MLIVKHFENKDLIFNNKHLYLIPREKLRYVVKFKVLEALLKQH